MESKKTIVLVSALLLIAGVNLWAQQPSVAVRSFQASGGLSQDEGNAITDIFISELVSTGKLLVVDRNSFETIIAERKFQASDWSDNNNIAKLGKAINANYIIQGTVTSLGGRIIINVRALDINTVTFVASPSLQLVKMDEIFTKIKPFVVDLVLNMPNNSSVYTVGSIGPSGGYVFYDKGSYSNGWRYLEAAPASTEISERWREANARCNVLNVNGLTGWRLPTKDELNLMYGNLKQVNLGNFNNEIYWSSSGWEFYNYRNDSFAGHWGQDFRDGKQGEYHDTGIIIARAVRAF